jgi:hypothetical protein
MAFQYLPGEMEAWSEFLKSGDKHAKFSLRCSYGHTLESPIELTQEETDARCIACQEGQDGN